MGKKVRGVGTVDKPGSVHSGGYPAGRRHLSSRTVTDPVLQPTRGHAEDWRPLLGLAPGEVYLKRSSVTGDPVVSYTTLSPLP